MKRSALPLVWGRFGRLRQRPLPLNYRQTELPDGLSDRAARGRGAVSPVSTTITPSECSIAKA